MNRNFKRATVLSLVPLVGMVGYAAAQRQASHKPLDGKLPTLLSIELKPDDSNGNDLRKLMIERHNVAVSELKAKYKEFAFGRQGSNTFGEVAKRVVDSGLELTDKPEERTALLSKYVELAKYLERIAREKVEAGVISVSDLHGVRYQTLDAEVQLLRARQASENSKAK